MFYGIGTTLETLTDLADLATPIPYPKSEPPYTETVECGDGQLHEIGAESTVWNFAFLQPDERAMLKTFCSGPSANIFICTRLADDTFGVRQAIMRWPKDPPREGGNFPNMSIEFARLVEVEIGS